ncbi:MAG TPA: cytochrome c oxidase assembly protein [Burkholderiales bacterium]|nr:cytochrome c oxidase assembly protein [Burkholderiales bacterium]
MRLVKIVPSVALGLYVANAAAHTDAPAAEAAFRWTFEPWVVACLALAAALYGAGALKLWRRAGIGRGLRLGQAAAFAGGWLTLCAALVSPLDGLGASLFSAHMLQHELLMIVAPPLFVLARPLETWTWGLPATWRSGAGQVAHWTPLANAWGALTIPLVAWAVHAAALWLWHTPPLFDAALSGPALHALQHASFLGSALLFWWAVLGRARHHGLAIGLVFTTMVHTGVLGALLTFSPAPWYRGYAETAAFGLSVLEDQQLGGLVMWVPGGFAYLAAGLTLAFRYFFSATARDFAPTPAISGSLE